MDIEIPDLTQEQKNQILEDVSGQRNTNSSIDWSKYFTSCFYNDVDILKTEKINIKHLNSDKYKDFKKYTNNKINKKLKNK